MIKDNIVFYSSLLICISLGSYYKKIEDININRSFGVGLGFLMAFLVCGHLICHSILMVCGNIIIIRCCDKRYIHLMSLSFTWIYLWYLHFILEAEKECVLWIHQIIALRLVGLAFEVTLSNRLKSNKPEDALISRTKNSVQGCKLSLLEKLVQALRAAPVPNTEADMDLTHDPNSLDIITYSYFFIGLHKGPYYRWKILNDHFNVPFGALGDCRSITELKIKKAIVCTLVYFIMRSKYNPWILYEPGFVTSYQSEARYLYCLPLLLMHFLRMNIVMMLCTSVFTETGFGMFPAKCEPLPGLGPSTQPSLLKATVTDDVALQQEYNFAMLTCTNIRGIFFGPKMRDTLRSWDVATGYWFWAYSYTSILKARKEIRSFLSFFLWTVWAGPSPQHFILSATIWIYINLEAQYASLFATENKAWSIGFSIMRALFLVYLAPCILVDDRLAVLRYYNSIYWVYHIVLLIFAVFAGITYQYRRRKYTVQK